jgi:hypothetical protein
VAREDKEHVNTDAMLRLTLENGGGTFDKTGSPIQGEGFVVGVHEGTFISVPLDDVDLFGDAIKLLTGKYTLEYIGTWVNGSVIHIDPVIVVSDRDTALNLGRTFHQKAIYDMNSDKVVEIG